VKLEKDDYFLLFSTPRGRRVLEDLCKWAPLLKEPMAIKAGVDVEYMLVESGRCDVLKHIYKKMKVDPFDEKKRQQFAVKGK
jgi:hypothetical protein